MCRIVQFPFSANLLLRSFLVVPSELNIIHPNICKHPSLLCCFLVGITWCQKQDTGCRPAQALTNSDTALDSKQWLHSTDKENEAPEPAGSPAAGMRQSSDLNPEAEESQRGGYLSAEDTDTHLKRQEIGLPRWLSGKESTCQRRRPWFYPCFKKSHMLRSS
ncbi:unnamed protein product [Rangifer tarandus platyrhynchus]|uniref:Uncharacterized protein n=1 Tax=Rangifer tarandus platyrhynchus TaxID=3082113 RepID=A0ABN8YIB6_RANTA|nr:unnamed protein product [Rangifer tarandus platyrhynchus]